MLMDSMIHKLKV